ncbi:MAG: DUF167 domain-containing protein [Acidimicrobiia bacterium]
MDPTRPAATPWARAVTGGWELQLRIQPGARRTEVVGALGDALKVRVAAPADQGKANAALTRFLAAALDVPVAAVSVARGAHGRSKVVRVEGLADPAVLVR